MIDLGCMLAGIFTQPLDMENNWTVFLWFLPLTIIISTVYKATKVNKVTNLNFVKESATLSATIIGFMILIAIVLWAVVAVFT